MRRFLPWTECLHHIYYTKCGRVRCALLGLLAVYHGLVKLNRARIIYLTMNSNAGELISFKEAQKLTPSGVLTLTSQVKLNTADKKRLTKRMHTLLRQALTHADFKSGLEKLRERHGAPRHGFNDMDKAAEWVMEQGKSESAIYLLQHAKKMDSKFSKKLSSALKLRKERQRFLREHELPVSAHWVLVDYMATGGKQKWCIPDYDVIWDYPKKEEERKWDTDISVKILVPEQTTKQDLLAFIEENWAEIKHWTHDKRTRVRSVTHEDVSAYILECSKKTKEELLMLCKKRIPGFTEDTVKYREELITRLVEHGYGVYISFDAIKKRLKRARTDI